MVPKNAKWELEKEKYNGKSYKQQTCINYNEVWVPIAGRETI